jgi:hypothetical protein
VVRLGGGVVKGEFMLNGFIAIKPENEIAKHLQLIANIHDAEHVTRRSTGTPSRLLDSSSSSVS